MFEYRRYTANSAAAAAPHGVFGGRRDRPRSVLPLIGFCSILLALSAGGCGALGLTPFPRQPLLVITLADGVSERSYDVAGDGHIDFIERLGSDGRVQRLRIDADHDGVFEIDVPWPPTDPNVRDLIIIADSIPYGLVDELWQQGRLRLFPPPTRAIAPFPVMTDPALAEYFHRSPCRAVEASYCDGEKLAGGMLDYLGEKNAPWLTEIDYKLATLAHGIVYLDPKPWELHELGSIERHFLEHPRDPRFAAYMVSTSALGARLGRQGHLDGLLELDRLCQSLVFQTRGQIRITLLSDHGHNLIESRRIDIDAQLRKGGFRPTSRIVRSNDVIVPEWGLVSCAAVNTRQPARVAEVLASVKGVDFSLYREKNAIHIVGRRGHATIEKLAPDQLVYAPLTGDPLQVADKLAPALPVANRGPTGRTGAKFVVTTDSASSLLADHKYPDAIVRAARAFDLFEHPPDVFVSLEDGYFCGSREFNGFVGVASAHGNFAAAGTCGFVMSTGGALPAALRNADAAAALEQVGVRFFRDRKAAP